MPHNPPKYGIIYNWDGAPAFYNPYPATMEQFLEKTYGIVRDTQVGAMFWSVGSDEVEWPSKDQDMTWEHGSYGSVRAMVQAENLRAMYERGENPYQAMVDRGHEMDMHVYASVRMNDNHFYGTRPEDFAKLNMGSKLRQDHPEWLLDVTDVSEQRGIGSWNLANLGARQGRLAFVTESFRQADWDGVELDWQRHAFHFPENDAYRLRYALTDLQRAVRQAADAHGKERGRPMYVAVRVSASLESCRRIGYDIERWAKEGLCDIIIAAGCSATDPGAEIAEFKRVTEGTGVQVYGGLDSVGRQDAKRLVPASYWRDAWLRSVAATYWDQGADGMYVFNWHGNEKTWRSLLTTIGSPETLKHTDKMYAALHKGPTYLTGEKRNAVNDRILGETAVPLFRTITGDGPTFTIAIADDLEAEAADGAIDSAELHIEMEHWAPNDRVAVTIDGQPLGEPTIRDVAAENPNEPSDISENKWLVWKLTPQQAAKGVHKVKVVLLERDARIRVPITVAHVEVLVRYSP